MRVNVDEAPGLATAHRAMSIPLLVVMRDGAEVDGGVGAMPKRQLEERLAPTWAPGPDHDPRSVGRLPRRAT